MKIFLPYTKYLALLIVCMLLYCSRFPDYPVDELLAAPEQIEIEGREYILETFMWRDFMPGPETPPEGKPMIAIIWVVAIDSLLFPSSFDADFLWVIKDDADVWTTEFEDNETSIEDNKLKKVARDGPKWGPHIYVDAVVRIVDDEDSTYLLRAADQWVYRTD